MSKKTVKKDIISRYNIRAAIAAVVGIGAYYVTIYVGSNISTSSHPVSFFQIVFLSMAAISLVSLIFILTAVIKAQTWYMRLVFILLASIIFVFFWESAESGLLIGAFTNF